MTSLALHTAARRYCVERHAYWCAQYAELVQRKGDRLSDGYHYGPEALSTFPRYNVLNAIRVEVERIDPVKLLDVVQTRELLICAGEAAQDLFTAGPIDDIAERAMAEERAAFCRYISQLTPSALITVESLPYRRVLAPQESSEIWSRLRTRWRISESYWFPLDECRLPDVVAFATTSFYDAVPFERLRETLASRGVHHLWELREYGPEYEEDLALFEPYYTGAEGYWSSGDLEWIVYASHESSITIGGWLLGEVKAMWPNWRERAVSA